MVPSKCLILLFHSFLFSSIPRSDFLNTHCPTTSIMVHVNRVSTDKEIESIKAQYANIDTIPITEEEEQDDYTGT